MLPVIIYTLPKLDRGGAELRSLQLLAYFRQCYPGLRIVVHCTSPESGRLDAAFEEAGIEIVRGGAGMRGLVDFHRHCRRHGATLAHVNAGMKSGFYILAACLAGVPRRFAHFRTETEDRFDLASRLRGRLGVWLMRLFGTGIVGVSDAARLYPRVPPGAWRTLYNGVVPADPARVAARRPARPVGARTLLVLGRIDGNKNCLRAVAVFEALRRRPDGGGWRLRFVGTGPAADLARLRVRIGASPDAGAIQLHDATDDPLSQLRDAAAVLLPSKREGLPGVVLEALATGTPVVASDIPATREIARAVTGIALVPLADPDMAWAEAIERAAREAEPAAIAAAFARGPFLFRDHAAAMAQLWGLPPVPLRPRAPEEPERAERHETPVPDEERGVAAVACDSV